MFWPFVSEIWYHEESHYGETCWKYMFCYIEISIFIMFRSLKNMIFWKKRSFWIIYYMKLFVRTWDTSPQCDYKRTYYDMYHQSLSGTEVVLGSVISHILKISTLKKDLRSRVNRIMKIPMTWWKMLRSITDDGYIIWRL